MKNTINRVKVDSLGNKWYYKNNKLNREDGPAIEFTNGYKAWYINHKLHRLNGPAVEWDKYGAEQIGESRSWYIGNKNYTQKQYFKELKKYIGKKEIFILKLKYQ